MTIVKSILRRGFFRREKLRTSKNHSNSFFRRSELTVGGFYRDIPNIYEHAFEKIRFARQKSQVENRL